MYSGKSIGDQFSRLHPCLPVRTRISIIGAGPSGLAAAFALAKLGYSNVTVLEKHHTVAGMCESVDIGGNFNYQYNSFPELVEAPLGEEEGGPVVEVGIKLVDHGLVAEDGEEADGEGEDVDEGEDGDAEDGEEADGEGEDVDEGENGDAEEELLLLRLELQGSEEGGEVGGEEGGEIHRSDLQLLRSELLRFELQLSDQLDL